MALPAIAAGLLGGLKGVAGSVAAQVLVSLGIGVVTYVGVEAGLDQLKGYVQSGFAGLPAEVVSLLAFMKVGTSVSLIFGALLARVTMKGFSAGVLKKWKFI